MFSCRAWAELKTQNGVQQPKLKIKREEKIYRIAEQYKKLFKKKKEKIDEKT